jgi:hypothetical protein
MEQVGDDKLANLEQCCLDFVTKAMHQTSCSFEVETGSNLDLVLLVSLVTIYSPGNIWP